MRLPCVALVLLGGCIEEQSIRLPSHFTDPVMVSKSEPEGMCRNLGAVEGRSRESDDSPYEAAYDTLRSNAALRGGNYVVMDLINATRVQSGGNTYEGPVVIQGRLYQCAIGMPGAHVVRMPSRKCEPESALARGLAGAVTETPAP
jgi:hypothetical protein